MKRTFYILIGGFLLGVAIRSLFEVGIFTLVFVFFALCCLLLVLWAGAYNKSILYTVLFFLVLILGVVRTEYAVVLYQKGRVHSEGELVYGRGVVISEADVRDTYALYSVAVNDKQKTSTVFRVKTAPYPLYKYGEEISITGEVHVPEAFETESGRVFDYPGYLMKEGVHYELRDTLIESKNTYRGNPLQVMLLSIKQKWLESIASVLPEPSSSLLGGLVVGAKQSLGDRWLRLFRDTGIIHIVVLSGYNLTLVANSIIRMTVRLPHGVRFFLGTAGIVSFAVMVGGGATVVRASVMAVLGMLAGFMKRRYVLLRALLLAGFMMVLWNPFVLLFDAGFQLSFMATAGLIAIAPHIEKYLGAVSEQFGLRAIVAATLATQLAVLPLLFFHIGTVSLVAPIVNVLVLPVVPAVMAVGFFVGLVGFVNSALAVPFAYCTHLLLAYIFLVVEMFAKVPYASVKTPPVSGVIVSATYALAVFVVAFIQKNHASIRTWFF